jgi:PAS domain S-box-containing protein
MIDNVEQLKSVVKKQKEVIYNLSKHYQSIFEHSKLGMVYVDTNGLFIDSNKKFCEMLGYDKDELLELTFKDITYYDDLEKDLRLNELTVKDGTDSFSLEKRYITKNKKIIWTDIFVNHIRNENGVWIYSVGIVSDIADRKKIQ